MVWGCCSVANQECNIYLGLRLGFSQFCYSGGEHNMKKLLETPFVVVHATPYSSVTSKNKHLNNISKI